MNALAKIIDNAFINIAVTSILIIFTSIILDITENNEYRCTVNIQTVRILKKTF